MVPVQLVARIISIILLLSVGISFEELERNEQGTFRFAKAIQGKLQQEWLEPPAVWREKAKLDIFSKEQHPPMEGVAKNTIFYIGDGMGIASTTVARIFKGQQDDGLRFGEEAVLHMDTFPWTGTSKTYCLDTQATDSSCSSTAYMCGIKARFSTAGLTPAVLFADCRGQNKTENHVSSVLAWAQKEGKSTGIITNSGITSIPGSTFWAGVAARGWETDADLREWGLDPEICPDIGTQLVRGEVGQGINVLLGGGRRSLTPVEEADPETGSPGKRLDGRNIVNEWLAAKPETENSRYITGRDQLLELDTSGVDNLWGAFSYSDLAWYEGLAAANDPTMAEMVEVAIKILSKNPNGYFLFVHGSKIDSAHHANKAGRAAREIVEFDKSVKKGDELTDDQDTLIVVTADHSHSLGFSGYNVRGNPVLGHSIIPADDGLVFPSVYFGNGPGPWIDPDTGRRRNVLFDDVNDPDYQTPVPVPLGSEAHGSEDVPIYAKGPYAHYFSGVHEQSTIPHLIAYASCTGEGLRNRQCSSTSDDATAGSPEKMTAHYSISLGLFFCFSMVKHFL